MNRAASPTDLTCPACWVCLICSIFLSLHPRTACGTGEADEAQASLQVVPWEVSVLSYRLAGTGCWLTGDEGYVRLEIRQAPTDSDSSPLAEPVSGRTLVPLLDQTGDGWTFVLGQDHVGTYNRWGHEWKRLPASLFQAVKAILTELEAATEGASSAAPEAGRRSWSARRPGNAHRGIRIQLPPLALEKQDAAEMAEPTPADETGLRDRLTTRGRGRGGAGEVLSLLRVAPDPAATDEIPRLEVRSTRRPGVLRIALPTEFAGVRYLDPEIFTPLWSLRDLITLPGRK